MITLKEEKNKAETLFLENNISYNENSSCLVAADKDEILGFCLFDIDNKRMLIKYIEPLNDVFLADGVLRSTLHIAAERGVMNAFYEDTVSAEFLKKIGFIKNENEKSLDIDKLFKSCCDCK